MQTEWKRNEERHTVNNFLRHQKQQQKNNNNLLDLRKGLERKHRPCLHFCECLQIVKCILLYTQNLIGVLVDISCM